MKGDMNASVRLSMRKVKDIRTDFRNISVDLPPQTCTNRILTWRNSVEGLQKGMEAHGKYLKTLAKDAPSSQSAFSQSLESFLHNLEKLENDFKLIVNFLRNLAFIPKSSELSSWDLILQSLVTELQKASTAVVTLPAEESFRIVEGVYNMRDALLSQLAMGLMHRKIILWMDLGILETGYVKGEVLDAVTKIIKFRDENGYIPTRIEYIHPKPNEFPSLSSPTARFDLVNILGTFSEEFLSAIKLIENNFKLTTKPTKRAPKAKSLRVELERVFRDNENLDHELQKARLQNRNVDKREWFQTRRELDEKNSQLSQVTRNLQKVNMEKTSFENECKQLKERIKHLENNLKEINEVYMPRLQEVEKTNTALVEELKQIRQDAEMLPSMFRNESYMKNRIKQEQIETEEKLKIALKSIEEDKTSIDSLKEELGRKDKIALHAIGARNAIERELRAKKKELENSYNTIAQKDQEFEKMTSDVQMYKEKHDSMQEHVFVQNNRINELEEQKKVLMNQLKNAGNHSEAHFTYKMLKK